MFLLHCLTAATGSSQFDALSEYHLFLEKVGKIPVTEAAPTFFQLFDLLRNHLSEASVREPAVRAASLMSHSVSVAMRFGCMLLVAFVLSLMSMQMILYVL